MRPNRAEPARGFSWQTSPQTRKMGRRATFAKEPARACRNTSGNRSTEVSRRASWLECLRGGDAPQEGGSPPPVPENSRRRDAPPACRARLSAAHDACLSAANNACLSAESGSPPLSICRTTISVMPLDHPRWAGSGPIRTNRSSGAVLPQFRRTTRTHHQIDPQLPCSVSKYPPPVIRPAIQIERQDFASESRPAPATSRGDDAFFSVNHGETDERTNARTRRQRPCP